jgi:ankyrin repeat protein
LLLLASLLLLLLLALCSYVDVRTQAGFTAAHFAVQTNSRQTLAVLLNMGANPLLSTLFDCMDTINCPKGTTALHLAARQGNEAIAKQLLRAYVSSSSVQAAFESLSAHWRRPLASAHTGRPYNGSNACLCSTSLLYISTL